MPTKLRSACDRCHQTKIRCSGDIPCQGCLLARTLCFYSVSNPLGRPRGTKNSQGRGRSRANNINRRQSASSDSLPRSTQRPKSAREPPAAQESDNYRKDVDDCMSVDEQTQNEVEVQHDNIPHVKALSTWNSSDSLSFGGSSTGDNVYNFSDFLPNSVFMAYPDGVTQPDSARRSRRDLTTTDTTSTATLSDNARSSYTNQSSPKTHSPDEWESVAFGLGDVATGLFTPNNIDDPAAFQTIDFDENLYHLLQQPTTTTPLTKMAPISASVPQLDPSVTAISQATTRRSSGSCCCLQQLAELMCDPRFSELLASEDSDDGTVSIDKALALVTQGKSVWRDFSSCPRCPYSHGQDAMLLALMSIRAIVRHLQRLAPRHLSTSRAGTCPTRGSTNASDAVAAPLVPPCSNGDNRVTVGSYEISGDERVLVYRALFQHMLKMVKETLCSLQTLQDQRKEQLVDETSTRTADDDDYQASSNMYLIQQISHKLFASVRALELSLNGA